MLQKKKQVTEHWGRGGQITVLNRVGTGDLPEYPEQERELGEGHSRHGDKTQGCLFPTS